MTRQPQKSLDLAPHPADLRQAQAEAILAEAYRAWFALKAHEADGTIHGAEDPIPVVERAYRAVRAASDRLLPFEADAVYAREAEEFHVGTGRNPETGRVGYWAGPGSRLGRADA